MNQDPNMNQNNFNNGYNQPMTNNVPNQNMNYGQPMVNNQQPMQQPNYNQPYPNQQMPGPMPMQQPMPGQQPMYNQPVNGMYQQPMQQKKFNPITIIIPVVIIALIVVLLLVTGNNNYKKPIELYCEGLNNLDINTINKALPTELINSPDNEIAEEIADMKQDLITYNANLTVTCQIAEEGVELTDEEVQELSDEFQYEFNTDRVISKAYNVDVTRTYIIEYENGKTKTDDDYTTVTVAKIDGKWYYIYED